MRNNFEILNSSIEGLLSIAKTLNDKSTAHLNMITELFERVDKLEKKMSELSLQMRMGSFN